MAEGLINNKTLIIQGILAEKCGLTPDLYDELADLLDDIRILSDAKDSALAEHSSENSGLHLQRVSNSVVCPECDGKGWIIPTDRVPYDCEKCKGRGKL